MRLLQLASDGGFRLTKDLIDDIPPYAILSHTWGEDDQELTFQDLQQHTGQHKAGYRKLTFCGAQAASDGLQYFWVDTCCIDKSSSAELTEAINSMFRWYQNAAQCYVFLADVSAGAGSGVEELPSASWTAAFRNSRWFSRGWTLQELIAPKSVTFFSVEGQLLGDKTSMEGLLQEITGIAADALRGQPLSRFSPEERFSWMRNRLTKRPEDRTYSLLGIFNIYLPLIYGEGEENASIRLREAIKNRLPEYSVTINDKCAAHFLVPFGQNENFVGRKDILSELHERLPPVAHPKACQRTVIEGLGGIGKTQVAIEAAYRVRDAYPDCSVFWVPAMNMAMFENAYREISRALGKTDEDKADVKKLVKAALSQADAGQWLLIIDNVDDMLLLDNGQLMSYLPFSRKGSILFTTRNHQVAVRLDSPRVISLPEPDRTEASELLHQGLEKRQIGHPKHTTELLKCLAYLPLAIKQASAYMASNRNVTIAKYIGFCRSSDNERVSLLSEEFTDQAHETVRNPVALTWLVSFEHIARDKPLAAEYLQFTCYLAEKDILATLFPPGHSDRAVSEAISTLEAYAFLQQKVPNILPGRSHNVAENAPDDASDDASDDAPARFDVHRLVRLIMRNWLREQGKEQEQVTKTMVRLAQVLPRPAHENREAWSSYLPHTQAVLEFEGQCNDERALWKVLLYTGMRTRLTGKYAEAEVFYKRAVDLTKIFGPAHPATLDTTNNLAVALHLQGKYAEAETIHRQTLERRTAARGPDHPDTLDSMNALSLVLNEQGKHDDAERLQRQALAGYRKLLGPEHPGTLSIMCSLSIVLQQKGKYAEAETIIRQTLELSKKVLGPDHPKTLDSMIMMAIMLQQQEKYAEAEVVHRQTLELRKTARGPNHPDTLDSIGTLSIVLDCQGKSDEAERLQRQALTGYRTVLGPGHPRTLSSMNNLAIMLQHQGKYAEAETIHRQTMELTKTALGPDHPHTLDSMNNLATLLQRQGQYLEAETIHRQTLPSRELVLGRGHPDTLKNIRLIAKVLRIQGKHAEAEQMDQQMLAWENDGRLREAEDERGDETVASTDRGVVLIDSWSPPTDQARSFSGTSAGSNVSRQPGKRRGCWCFLGPSAQA